MVPATLSKILTGCVEAMEADVLDDESKARINAAAARIKDVGLSPAVRPSLSKVTRVL